MHIEPIPAFKDNYIWNMVCDGQAVVVDPGDSVAVIRHLEARQQTLTAILVTHHHKDHTGGVAELADRYACPVFGPKQESTGTDHVGMSEGDTLTLPQLGLSFQVLDIPGHTLGHIAFASEQLVFCGDTLFSGGCGRLFEGTPQQMYNSLQKLASLGDATHVYCAHEYTESNLTFAVTVEPNNEILQHRLQAVRELRRQGRCTLPTSVEIEKATNPFLRVHVPEVQEAARHFLGRPPKDPVETLAAIRKMKDLA